MEHHFQVLEKGKLKTYEFYDGGTPQEKVADIIRLHKQGMIADYITGELGVSHVFVAKTVREYRESNQTDNIQH